jgi:hypothetical protein
MAEIGPNSSQRDLDIFKDLLRLGAKIATPHKIA